jgi:hypothetical protein
MIETIISGTAFQRTNDAAQALVMGVIELGRNALIKESWLYPMSIASDLVGIEGAREALEPNVPAHQNTFDEMSIDANLARPIWPIDHVAFERQGGQWFYSVLLPLEVSDRHFFFYAAAPGPVFPSTGDTWHQFLKNDIGWTNIKPLCRSEGHNANTLSRTTFWPINGEIFAIDTNPAAMRELMEWARGFYLYQYHKGASTDSLYDTASRAAVMAGHPSRLVAALLPSLHAMYLEENYMKALEMAVEICPFESVGRSIPAMTAQARSAAMHKAIMYHYNRS